MKGTRQVFHTKIWCTSFKLHNKPLPDVSFYAVSVYKHKVCNVLSA